MTDEATDDENMTTNENTEHDMTTDEMRALGTRDLRPHGWRHGATWTYLVTLLASAVALIVSFILSAETLQLARHPKEQLGCDVNAVLSCSTVAQSWQSEIVKFAGLSFPNAFFGIAAESVFVTIAVIGLARVRVPRWFAACTWLGGLAALLYSYWLTSQSLFVINALCPWCLALMFSTTIQFMALSHATVVVQGLPGGGRRGDAGGASVAGGDGVASGDGAAGGVAGGNAGAAADTTGAAADATDTVNATDTVTAVSKPRGLDTYYRLNYDLMVDFVWILAIVVLIVVKDGTALFM